MNKLIVELVGTFFFLSVILHTGTDKSLGPHSVAIALLAVIYFGASVSGAHFNPAVSAAMYLEGNLPAQLAALYVAAQLIGAAAAWKFNSFVLKNN